MVFSEKYFNDAKESMDEISFNCLYQQKPVEREGLLLPPDKLKRFFFDREDVPDGCTDEYVVMPKREPDAIWAVCDTKDKGTDFESLPIAYQYGDKFFFLFQMLYLMIQQIMTYWIRKQLIF